jgi:5-aminolevulinate synthase
VERELQQARVAHLRSLLTARRLPVMENDSHIVPVMVGNAEKCKALTDTLLREFQFYLQPINFPTVPENTERVRITPGPLHSEESLEQLVGALDVLWTRLELPRTA